MGAKRSRNSQELRLLFHKYLVTVHNEAAYQFDTIFHNFHIAFVVTIRIIVAYLFNQIIFVDFLNHDGL